MCAVGIKASEGRLQEGSESKSYPRQGKALFIIERSIQKSPQVSISQLLQRDITSDSIQ